MRLTSLAALALAVALGAGCGARTGEDELLTTDLTGVGGLPAGGSGGLGSGGFSSGGGPSTGGGGPGACCEVAFGPGCPDATIQSCVCAEDTFCCSGAWDATCVVEVEEFGCGTCELGTGGVGTGGVGGTGGLGTGGGPSVGDCCTVQMDGGCSEPGIESCVCQLDRFCCEAAWDEQCVTEVSQCDATCGGGTGGSGGSGGSAGDCCEPHPTTGCEVPSIEQCVCAADMFCCNNQWDSICVSGAEECAADCSTGGSGGVGGTGGFGNGGTPGTGGSGAGGSGGVFGSGGTFGSGGILGSGGGSPVDNGNCCVPHMGVECSNPSITSCVCYTNYLDSYCCESGWDALCASEAEGCGAQCDNPTCDAFPGTCENCACNSCYASLTNCAADAGCLCIVATGCSGFDCLAPETCGSVLTDIASISMAYELDTCTAQAGCACP